MKISRMMNFIIKNFNKFIINSTLVVFSIVFSLLCIELAVRIKSPFYTFSPRYPIGFHLNELATSQPQTFDEVLGYKYKSKFWHDSHPNFGNKIFRTYSDGTRSNINKKLKFFKQNNFKQPAYDPLNLIIATGDSFTAGNEVGNNETWPALLEQIGNNKFRLINGGVGGYSTIQAVLMGEQLLKTKKAHKLIVSIIPEMFGRAIYSIFQGVPRPYYVKNNLELVLKYDHIKKFNAPSTGINKPDKINMKKYLDNFGRSFLLMEIIKRTYPNPDIFYYYGLHKKGDLSEIVVGCKIMERLGQNSIKNNIEISVLFQYPDHYFYEKSKYNNKLKHVKEVKLCAHKNNLTVLDMYDSLNDIFMQDKKKFDNLYIDRNRHMSPNGNLFTAKFIKNELIKIGSYQ
jgi:hypothetical protein